MKAMHAAVLVIVWLLAACVPSQATQPDAQAAVPANPFDKPVAAAPVGPLNPDRSCKVDADCAVKDVGNCCGHYPMCVNRDARTDPQAVRAQCARSGMASVCGFPEIAGCSCVQGQCRARPRAASR